MPSFNSPKKNLVTAFVTTSDPRVLAFLAARNMTREEYLHELVSKGHINFDLQGEAATIWFIIGEESAEEPVPWRN